MHEDCLFCRIAHGRIPAELLYEDELVVAFRDIQPVAPVHILIVPKRHIPDVLHLTPEDAAALSTTFAVAGDLARREGIDADGFRMLVNTGPAAGQTVPHLHFHLLGGRTLGPLG